jgi:hypothetical protein
MFQLFMKAEGFYVRSRVRVVSRGVKRCRRMGLKCTVVADRGLTVRIKLKHRGMPKERGVICAIQTQNIYGKHVVIPAIDLSGGYLKT